MCAMVADDLVCLDFLLHGEQVRLGASMKSTFGEFSKASMLRVVRVLAEEFGLGSDSIFLDVGAGRGLPNIYGAFAVPLLASVGVEFDA